MAAIYRPSNTTTVLNALRSPADIARETEIQRRLPAEADAYQQQTAATRGEIYVPDPYGVAGYGGGSATGTRTGTAGSPGGIYPGGGYVGAGAPAGNNVVASPGSGGGNINLSRGSYEDQQAMQLRAKLANDALERVYGKAGGGTSAQVQYGGGGAADAARAAAFARAKEQAGLNANAALESLQDVMGRRGLRGSSIEAGATGDIIQGGGTDIAKVITQQMQDELANIQHVSDTTYQGNIAQRGQDLQAKQALLSVLAGLY